MLGGKVYVYRAQWTHNDCNDNIGRHSLNTSQGNALPRPAESSFVWTQRTSWSSGESEHFPITAPSPSFLVFYDASSFLLIFCDDFPPCPFNHQLSCRYLVVIDRSFIQKLNPDFQESLYCRHMQVCKYNYKQQNT